MQNASTRGIFRIPGSIRVVTALFDYYCASESDLRDVNNTVRCSNLPLHIRSSVHDVASTFKKFLSVLPGGILGSLSTFDAMVSIHSQLTGSPEFPRTKQTKLRARLIALAISAVASNLRQNLICAVFGLLSLIGRIAEIEPREDAQGRPLPTSDLMGYNALGIVFGPLLVGDLLDQYTMKITMPDSGLVLFPRSPLKPRRIRKTNLKEALGGGIPTVNKILVANDIVEMMVSNWRDVVRQLSSLEKGHVDDDAHQFPSNSLTSQQRLLLRKRHPTISLVQDHDIPDNKMAPSQPNQRTVLAHRTSSSNRKHEQGLNPLNPSHEENRSFGESHMSTFMKHSHDLRKEKRDKAQFMNKNEDQSQVRPAQGWRGQSRLDSPRVSACDVPIRTSSKRDHDSLSSGHQESILPSPPNEENSRPKIEIGSLGTASPNQRDGAKPSLSDYTGQKKRDGSDPRMALNLNHDDVFVESESSNQKKENLVSENPLRKRRIKQKNGKTHQSSPRMLLAKTPDNREPAEHVRITENGQDGHYTTSRQTFAPMRVPSSILNQKDEVKPAATWNRDDA